MKDTEKRAKGKYKEVYSKIIDGVKVEITEETFIGRDYEVMNFAREYNPPVPYKMPSDGKYENTVTKTVKGKTFTTVTVFEIKDKKVINHKTTQT